jgi:phage tail sheath gpL-like
MPATINVPGFPASQKTPGIYLAVILGGPGTSAGAAPKKIILLGNMIGSNLTGASPSFTVTAGTAAANVPVQLASSDDAKTKFGAGSELHLMSKRVFAIYPQANLWAVPTSAGTGQATGVITWTGTPTAAYTARVVINGQSCDTAVAASDSVTTIATNVATTINQQTDWPVTAQFSAGVLTISAKQVGLRGNQITFRLFLIQGTTSLKATAGALAQTMSGSTATLSGGTVVGNVYVLSGGSTEEANLTTSLANIAATKYDRYACAQTGSTLLGAVSTQLTSMAGVTTQLRQQAIAANVLASGTGGTGANAVALALNAPRFQLCWHYASDVGSGEIAAAVAAARVIGDSAASGSLVGEATDPAANLDGLGIAGIPAQDAIADQPTPTTIESELNVGVTPLVPSSANPGFVKIPRVITTRWQDGSGNPNFAVIDTSDVTVPDYEADLIQGDAAVTYAGMKLGPDASDGSGPKIPNMTTPNLIRNHFYQILKNEESLGHIINVDAHYADLVVVADSTAVGRVLADIPIVPAPALHQVAGNVRQLSN